MHLPASYRTVLRWVAVMGVVAAASSFYAQYGQGLNPCPLCILQRVAVLFTTVAAVVCLLLPAGRHGRTAAALLVSAPALWGMGVGIYQLWLQSLPPLQQPACGAPWSFRLRDAPLFEWYEPIVRGTGQCGTVERVLGVPLPWWSVLFAAAVLGCLWGGWYRLRQQD